MQFCNECGNGNSQSAVFKLKVNFLFSPVPVSVTYCYCSISSKGFVWVHPTDNLQRYRLCLGMTFQLHLPLCSLPRI